MDESINHVGKNVLIHLRGGGWIPVLAPIKNQLDEDSDTALPCPEPLLVEGNSKPGEPPRRAKANDPNAKPIVVPFVQGKCVHEDATGMVVEMNTDLGGLVRAWFPMDVIFSTSVTHRLGELPVVQRVNAPLIVTPP